MGAAYSADDARRYRRRYPGKADDPASNANLRFYSNELRSQPSGDLIDNIHKTWHGDYRMLEEHHGYIQWLFPIREQGVNGAASELQLHEAAAIAASPALRERLVRSYEMMLDFYGMRLADRTSGAVERAPHWRARYTHLDRSFHNNLRITRMLKCLGECGFEHYKAPFVRHVLVEIFEKNELQSCAQSACKFWAAVLRARDERRAVLRYIARFVDDVDVNDDDDDDDSVNVNVNKNVNKNKNDGDGGGDGGDKRSDAPAAAANDAKTAN